MTLKDFNKVASEFFELCGQQSFWQNPKKIELAKKAVEISYLSVQETDIQQAAITYQTVMNNFTHRALILGVEI